MPTRQTTISPLNTLAMRPVDNLRPARYHGGHLDTEWQKDLVLSFQEKAYYLQKMERGDRFRFMAKCTANTAHTLKVLDCHGITVLTITQSASAAPSGDLTASGDQLTSYLYRLANLSAITADGVYYFLFSVIYDSTHSEQFISEPVLIQDLHEDTVLQEYSHSENKDDILFEQLPVRFPLRVEGFIGGFTPQSSDTVYEDQNENIDLLDSTAYRGWTFYVGQTGEGIPDWLLDKMQRIMSLDYVLFNGKQYRKASAGAKWNIDRSDANPLVAANIEIREADNTEGFTTVDAALDLYTSPGYPYAVQSLAIGRGGAAYIALSGTPAVIHDSTEETAFITAINAALTGQELFGTVTKVGSIITYQNGTGEQYDAANAVIRTTSFGYNFISPGPSGSGPVIYPGTSFTIRRGPVIIEWGDGTIEQAGSSSIFSSTTVSHIYTGAAGTYGVKIWGGIEGFTIADPLRSGLSGTLPANLKTLSITYGSFTSNTFDFAILTPVRTILNTLVVTSAGLTSYSNFSSNLFPVLKTINFSQNALTQTKMSDMLNDTYNNARGNSPIITGGTLSLVSQTPAVTLDARGAFFKSLLTGFPYGWTVNT